MVKSVIGPRFKGIKRPRMPADHCYLNEIHIDGPVSTGVRCTRIGRVFVFSIVSFCGGQQGEFQLKVILLPCDPESRIILGLVRAMSTDDYLPIVVINTLMQGQAFGLFKSRFYEPSRQQG
jgi:hypothetical protein